MKNYLISVKRADTNKVAYFAGVSENLTTNIPAVVWSGNSFHTARVDMEPLIFTERRGEAKILQDRITLKSYVNRILEQLPYLPVEIDEIRIELLNPGEDTEKEREK